jgi:hypothetical protein
MTNTVLIKRSGTANAIPLAGNIALGELAINYNDGNLFYKDAGGAVRLLTSNQFVSVAGNVTGANFNTGGNVSATGNIIGGNANIGGLITAVGNITGGNITTTGSIYGAELWSTNSVGSEGGQINLAVPASGSTISGGIVIDVFNNLLRFYERSGTNRGAFIDITAAAAGVGSNLLAGGGSTPTQIVNGTSNVVVASSGNVTVGVAGTAAVATFTTAGIVANSVSATNNGAGTNFQVGDDAWIGDVNNADTISIRGQQNAANGYIVFGNADNTTTLGRSGSGPLTYLGAFSATGNIISGNLNAAGLSLSSNVVSAINSTSNITTTANVAGSYFLGNGSQLTGISTSTTKIFNGTSEANIGTSGGNANISIGGVSNVAVFTTAGLNITGVMSASGNITGGNLITAADVSAVSVSASGNITGGNLITGAAVGAASVSATGNITGGNIIGVTDVVVPTVRNTAALTISTSSGNLNLQPTGNVVVNSTYINGVTNPVQNQDVATKIYVDNAVSTAISYHEPVVAATTTTLATTTGGTISYTQPNGAGNGVGALLTTTGSFDLIDTANIQTLGTRILVKNEANAVLNGVYTWANATNIVRATDSDTYGAGNVSALGLNDYFFTTGGSVNQGAAFVVSAPTGTITFGTSNIVFSTFSTSQTYTANTAAGISLAGTVINAKVDGTTTAFDGGGNISVKASATLTTPNIGAATGTSLSVTGNVTGGNLNADGLSLSSNVVSALNATGNIAGGNITTPGLISATGNITGGNVLGGANVNATTHTGTTVSVTGNITGGNLLISGAIIDSAQLDLQTSAANADIVLTPNGTGIVGVATSLSVTGNITGGNVLGGANVNATTHTGTTVSVTGNITGGNVLGGANVNATTHTGTTVSVTGTITGASVVGGVMTGSSISVTGAVTGAGITGTSLTVSTGTVTLGNIVNANGNGVGNIGSSTTYFNTVFAKATSAQYADLAEMYLADADYPPGTVLIFGGEQEVTAQIQSHSTAIAGVVSENPSHLMNADLQGEHVAAVALLGRVPCQVQGNIRKGDLLVASNTAGVAQRLDSAQYLPGCVIGKSLENYNSAEVGTIEIAVGIK